MCGRKLKEQMVVTPLSRRGRKGADSESEGALPNANEFGTPDCDISTGSYEEMQ